MAIHADSSRYCAGCLSHLEKSYQVCPNCGINNASFDNDPPKLKVRTVLSSKYMVGRALGQGGFGITYLGLDMLLGLRVAIKEYYPDGNVYRQMTGHPTVMPYTQDANHSFLHGRDRFLEEARLLARVSTDRSVVKVRDFFQENNTVYIVMEYVEGRTLAQLIKDRGGRLNPQEALTLIRPVIRVLDRLHAMGVLHRDISPDNIMLRPDGSLVLLDFGAAQNYTAGQSKTMTVSLKRGYAPIEQYDEHGSQGPWTDVYALCATLYQMIAGQPPTSSVDRLTEKKPLALPEDVRNKLNPAQEDALLRGLALYSRDRTPSMRELEAQLFGLSTASQTTEKKKHNVKRMVLAALGVTAAIAALIVLPKLLGTTPSAMPVAGPTATVPATADTAALPPDTTPEPTSRVIAETSPAADTPVPTETPVPTAIPQSLAGVSLVDTHVDEATQLQYSLHNNQAIITAYLGNAETLEIPPIIERYIVSVLHADFSKNSPSAQRLASIVLPSTLVSLEDGALNACTHLTSLTGGENLVYVSKFGFDQTPWYQEMDRIDDRRIAFNGVLLEDMGNNDSPYIGFYPIRLISSSAYLERPDITWITISCPCVVAENAFASCSLLTTMQLESDGISFLGPVGSHFETPLFISLQSGYTANFSNLLLALSGLEKASLSCDKAVHDSELVPSSIYYTPIQTTSDGLWTYRTMDLRKRGINIASDAAADEICYIELGSYNGWDKDVVFVPEKIGLYPVRMINAGLNLVRNPPLHPEVKVVILPTTISIIDGPEGSGILGMSDIEYIGMNGASSHGIWLSPVLLINTPYYKNLFAQAEQTDADCVIALGEEMVKWRKNQSKIVIPPQITSFVDGWNDGMTAVTDVTLPMNNSFPDLWQWKGFTNVKTVRMTTSGYIPDGLFAGDTQLEEIIADYSNNPMEGNTGYPQIITIWLQDRDFSGCTALKSVPPFRCNSEIGEETFYNCVSLGDIGTLFEQGIDQNRVIKKRAFMNCSSIPEIIFANVDPTFVGTEAFANCTSVKNVQIPPNVTLEARAFSGCSALTRLRLSATSQIDETAFAHCKAISEVWLYKGSDPNLLATLLADAEGPITVSCLPQDAKDVKLPDKFVIIPR